MNETKIIKNIGSLKGRLLFFGGVYSNLQSLEALKKWADENEFTPDKIFCTGDILGYCAQPVECIDLIREWGIASIAGNVELQVRNAEDNCGCDFKSGGRCDLFSKKWYSFIRAKINKEAKDWLHSLPHHIHFTYANKKVTIVHGSRFHTSDFIFKSTPWSLKLENIMAAGSEIVVAGHSGLPFADFNKDYLWLNAGAIGMPANEGIDRGWFIVTGQNDDNRISYRFCHYHYNNRKASELIRMFDLPATYADTLLTGIWDNCEILPEEEAANQGKAIIPITGYF